ncbi:MAG: hypothetical protein IKV81_01930 [Clostridia bacterium]|nr:hypothetical protein [Clostridia bacterium]
MQSVLGEISKLRKGLPIVIDYNNSNRYRVVAKEDDGSKTAYYFSTPIYNYKSRGLIDGKFHSNGGAVYAVGSNASITVFKNIFMENIEGACTVELTQRPIIMSENELLCGDSRIFPTANGVALKCDARNNKKTSFIIEVSQPFLIVRSNDRCFALMKEKFRPFVVFSCIGSLDSAGNVIAPAKIEYQKLTDKRYSVEISATSPLAQNVLLEANLYENKLFQDTTVESGNPFTNNAFGVAAFIGDSLAYGLQWLYSRADYSKISEIMDKRVAKAVLHIPKFNKSSVEVTAHKVSARFCSFGSNWNNRISSEAQICDSHSKNGYQSLDVTPLFVDKRTKTIAKSEGLILKPQIKGAGFSAITTGDSCFAPQILEINYR